MNIDQITAVREQLQEAIRYVDSQPGTCRQMIGKACEGFGVVDLFQSTAIRLSLNLQVAVESLLVDPEIARGYILGAVHELGAWRSELINATRDGRERANEG